MLGHVPFRVLYGMLFLFGVMLWVLGLQRMRVWMLGRLQLVVLELPRSVLGHVPFRVLYGMLFLFGVMLWVLGLQRMRVWMLGRLQLVVLRDLRKLLHVGMLVVLVGMPRLVLGHVLWQLFGKLLQELFGMRRNVRVVVHGVVVRRRMHIGVLSILQELLRHVPGMQRMLGLLVGMLGVVLVRMQELVRHLVRRRMQFRLQGDMREGLRIQLLGRLQLVVLDDLLGMLGMQRIMLWPMRRRMLVVVLDFVLFDVRVVVLLGRLQLVVLDDLLGMLGMQRIMLWPMRRRMLVVVLDFVLFDVRVVVPVDMLGTIEIGGLMTRTYEPGRETVDYIQRLSYEAEGMRETIDYIISAHAGDPDASVVEGAPFRALAAQCAQAHAAYRAARDEFQASMPEWAQGLPWSLDFQSGICTVEDGR